MKQIVRRYLTLNPKMLVCRERTKTPTRGGVSILSENLFFG